ncbi:nuclear pore complex protein Nup214-like isoform X2 [Zerene cesonia]|uniref:nuclear pore complex protein Nup214-like isoform X2 n=1 Tax=Zerene cesonia TaxID=33412 RepID=UPI0018E54A6E|nr:nuclear pore complex protein Nup214-like isoform X2 [Zerene cesonia]
MDVQFGPNAIDESNLLYKLQRKIKVFNTSNLLPNRGYNLLTTSRKYGTVFVASPQGVLSVYNIDDLIKCETDPKHLSVKLSVQPTHIAVNCDQEWLAVVGSQMLLVYKVSDFQNPNVGPSATIKCDINPSTFVSSLQWNPSVPDTIGIVFFDGTLVVCQVSTMQKKQIQSTARCLCWSPKGKQLVTGNNDGTLCQYKPDLSPMKSVPAPNLFEGAPVEALAIYWISTYQFAVVYRNASDNSRPALTIVSTPKGAKPACLNYEDICYSMGSNRPWYYYLHGIAQWNIIISSSSNSMEIATLGSKDCVSWMQWCQNDEARPELPLTAKKEENYPVGLCIDTSDVQRLPWGENEVLPPMPFLLIVSQTGLLTIFNIINLDKGAAVLCTPPQTLKLVPTAAMTSEIPDDAPQQQPEPQAQPSSQPAPVIQQPQAVMQPSPPAQQPLTTIQQLTKSAQQTLPTVEQPSTDNAPFSLSQVQSAIGATATFNVQTQAKPAAVTVSTTPVAPKSTPVQITPSQTATVEANAALKSEQEKANKAKVEQELKNMLVKEVNDFQMELYKFMTMTKESQNKIQQEIDSVKPNSELHTLNAEQLKKECSVEELRESVIQLKLELVRACAVIAEAKTHAEVEDFHEWTQADPLTIKRLSSIKKLAYYVQNQLDQAQKALDFKWNEVSTKNQYGKPGQRMIRPILDDVYQPLVKQQEILSRQQAVLKTLRNTLNECNMTPMIKSTSLLRSTPFKNKDPLTKLTKNILNMSIEPQNNKEKELSAQKLDALRDMISNHRPKKIKPVSVEIRQHLEAMWDKYKKGVKERAEKREMEKRIEIQKQIDAQKEIEYQKQFEAHKQIEIQKQIKADIQRQIEAEMQVEIRKQIEAQMKNEAQAKMKLQQAKTELQPAHQINTFIKMEPKPQNLKESPISMPTFSPASIVKTSKPALGNVARSLFTGETKTDDAPKQQPQISVAPIKAEPIATNITAPTNQRSLQDYLKSDVDNLLQNVCSPTSFSFAKPTTTNSTPSSVFSSKPIAGMTSMFSKFTESPAPDTKPVVKPNVTSDETGELETSATPTKPTTQLQAKENKPLQNIFSMKTSTPLTNVQNVPDLVKGNQITLSKTEVKSAPKAEKEASVPKENVTKPAEAAVKISVAKKESELKPFPIQSLSFPPGVTPSQPVFVGSESPAVTTSQVTSTTSAPAKASNTTPETTEPPTATATVASTPDPIKNQKEETTEEKPPTTSQSEQTGSKPETPVASTVSSPATPTASTTTTQATTSATPQSVFGSAVSKSSIFSAPSSEAAQPLFGSSTQVTNTTTTATSSFGSAGFGSSLFGSTTTTPSVTTVATSSVFGAASAQSVFSTANKTAFGTPATSGQGLFSSTTTQASTFGGGAVFSSNQSVFGTSSAQSTVFGSNAQPVFGSQTTQSSTFGASSPTTQSSTGSIFGTSTSTTQSLFGSSTAAQPVFGNAATTPTSVFGAPTSQTTVFGSPTSQSSVFGSTTPASSVFAASPTTQSSLFGTSTTSQAGPVFGDGGASLFASVSISSTSAPSQSGGNLFGSSSASVFGSSNTNVFGAKSTFSGNNPTAASIFGGSNNSGGGFGQKPATDFWSGGNTASSGFGSGFGQPATTQSSLFGSSGGSFSQPSTGQPFSSPQKASVFGSPQQQSAPAFGGSPVFGSKPVFSSPPSFGASAFGGVNKSPSGSFGGSATFGGAPAFGGTGFGNTSPGKVFGATSPGFGSPTQSNATFENLATQNTLTFGNLAQQSGQAPQPAPSFNTSPSFSGWRG